MTPAVAKSFGEAAAAADPRAIALTVEKNQQGDNDKAKKGSPDNPDLVRCTEERIEKQGPSVNDAVGAPGIVGELRVLGERLTNPLVLHRILEQEFRDEEKEDPLKTDERNVSPNLEFIMLVYTPAFDGLGTKDGHERGVNYCIPK